MGKGGEGGGVTGGMRRSMIGYAKMLFQDVRRTLEGMRRCIRRGRYYKMYSGIRIKGVVPSPVGPGRKPS